MKLKLVQPILGVLLPILCSAPDDEDEEEVDEVESHTPHSFAAQVGDRCKSRDIYMLITGSSTLYVGILQAKSCNMIYTYLVIMYIKVAQIEMEYLVQRVIKVDINQYPYSAHIWISHVDVLHISLFVIMKCNYKFHMVN